MKKGKHLYRGLMLKALLDKEYYNPTMGEIMLLFKNIKESSLEVLAKDMIPLIEQSETEGSVEALSGIGEEFSHGGEKFQRKLNSTREILTNVDLNTTDLSKRGGDQLAAHLKDYQEKEEELKKHEAKVRSLSEKILKMRHDRENGKPYVSSEMDALLTERNRETILASQVRRSMCELNIIKKRRKGAQIFCSANWNFG